MMIDEKEQGKGYGSEAFDRVIEFIRTKPFGDSDRVVLTCNKDNTGAMKLYESKGFSASGNEDGEEIFPEIPDGESFTEQAEMRADMLSVMMTLDETDRKIIDLRMEDLTQEQIAARLNMTQSAVSKRLKKLEKKFAEFRS